MGAAAGVAEKWGRPPLGILRLVETTIIYGVELVSVGMKWSSANGPITFTFQHLADAVEAGNEDPHIVAPRAKIGHSDPRFEDPNDPGHDPFYDGEPALGSYRNLRLVNDGATMLGDWTECPVWLAEALPTAYPSRSIEGAWSMTEGAMGEPIGSWDVTTEGGKTYSFVLTACASLGITRPAVADLEDLRRFLTEGDGIVIAGTAPAGGAPADASIPAVANAQAQVVVAAREGVAASADVEHVIESFYADFAVDDTGRYWWWCRAVWTDPNQLIVDDDEGSLFSVPFTSDGEQNVTFGEPEKVLQTFTPAPANAAAVVAQEAGQGKPAATYTERTDDRLPQREKPAKPGGSKASAPLPAMDFSKLSAGGRKRLVASLSLAEDATDEQITEALEADEQEPETGADGAPATPAEPEAKPAGEPEAPAASGGPETVTVEKAVWDETVSNGKLGAEARAAQVTEHRKGILDGAIAAGKIMPSSREAWETKLNAAPEATEAEIEKLQPGLVPVAQSGHSANPAEAGGAIGGMTAAEATAQLFPNLATERGDLNG